MKLKDSELKSILAEVESELAALAKSEGATLRKAAGDEGADEGADSAPAEGAAEASGPAEGSAPGGEGSAPGAEASGPAEGAAPEAGAMAPEASAPGADPAAMEQSAPLDPESLKAEYSQLDPESLKMHYMAAKAALFEVMGAGGGAGPEASAAGAPGAPPAGPEMSAGPGAPPAGPPAGPEMSAGPGAPPMPPPALKAEVPASMKKIPANGDALKDQSPAVPDAIKKNEAEISDLKQQVDLLAKALDIALGTPQRKAVTSVAHLAKTEGDAPAAKPMSKTEVKERIRTAVSSGKLSKSEKDKLFSFTLGNVEFDDIKDLLDRK